MSEFTQWLSNQYPQIVIKPMFTPEESYFEQFRGDGHDFPAGLIVLDAETKPLFDKAVSEYRERLNQHG